jgi:hypothetical protein
MSLPRTTSDNDRSMERGGPSRRGKTAAIGLVPNNARVPPQAGMAEGELPKVRPTKPSAPTGSMCRAAAPK